MESCLHARGRPEDDLARAEQLVERQQYDEAIRVLAEVIRRNPDLFDAAQTLLERVRNAQRGFNDRYEQLLKVLYDERDVEKALKIIAELEAADPNPNKATRDAIAQAKRGALVQANRNRFDALMDQALARLREGDAAGALNMYFGAFAFHREEFDASPLGNVAKNAITAAQESVRSSAATFLEISAALALDNKALAASATGDGRELQQLLGLQRERLVRTADLVATAEHAAQTLARQRQAMPRGSDPIEYFLFYSEKAIAGRAGREADEGIRRTEELGLQQGGAGAVAALRQAVDGIRPQAVASFQSGDWRGARDAFLRLEPLSRALVEFAYLHETRKNLEAGYDPAKTEGLVLRPDLPVFLEAQHLYREQVAYIALAAARLDAAAARTPAGWDTARLAAPVAAVEGLASDWSRYAAGLRTASAALGRRAEDVLVAAGGALREWREGIHVTLEAQLAAGERLAVAEEQLLREGEQARQADGGIRTVYYPNRRLAQFNALRARAAEIAGAVSSALQGAGDTARLASAGSTVAASVAALEALRGRVDALAVRAEKGSAEATARTLAADGYRRQGDNEYRSAQAAFGRGEYGRARESLATAAEAYDRSLEIQEDPAVRDLRDRGLPAFLAEVNKGENNRVVGEVRRLIEAAIAAYRRTQFREAEDLLVNAQARWKDANAEVNTEIENWLAVVRRALSTQEGWELVETQPLYREIVQLLKFAGDDFARGEALEAQRQREQAQLAFTAAQEKLDTINLTVPRLKSANFLRLKITQKLEPALFVSRLAEVKADARTAMTGGAPKALSDSYSELSDFAQIVTNDRDLAGIIERMEVLLGRRPAPPDPARIAESRARYREAQRIYDARQRDLYGQAVRLLDESIALYPENRDAVLLKDRILIDTGGARQDIITSDDLKEFRLAEKLFSENNYPTAVDIVKRLLQNSANRNYPPLLDLRDKLAKRGFR